MIFRSLSLIFQKPNFRINQVQYDIKKRIANLKKQKKTGLMKNEFVNNTLVIGWYNKIQHDEIRNGLRKVLM